MKRCCYVTLSSVIVEDSLYSIIFFVKIGSLIEVGNLQTVIVTFLPKFFQCHVVFMIF
jgi:hypothetical protein